MLANSPTPGTEYTFLGISIEDQIGVAGCQWLKGWIAASKGGEREKGEEKSGWRVETEWVESRRVGFEGREEGMREVEGGKGAAEGGGGGLEYERSWRETRNSAPFPRFASFAR